MLFFFASLIPFITLFKLPNLVIFLYELSSIVSKDTLIRSTPFFFKSFAKISKRVPFVVKVISLRFVYFFFIFNFSINLIKSFLTKGRRQLI